MRPASSARVRAEQKAPKRTRADRVRHLSDARSACVFAALLALPGLAEAQSLYGCEDLLSAQVPSYEGGDGVFFRVDPDLLMYNRMSDEVVEEVGRLSQTLSQRGTALVFVPLPTKSLAMPDHLGPDVAEFGYDPAVAATIFDDTVRRLEVAGVTTVDARRALRTATSGEPVFFKTDPRLGNAGILALAQATAEKLSGAQNGPSEAIFTSEATGEKTLPSLDRFHLQLNCQAPLPDVTTMGFVTRRVVPKHDADSPAPLVVAGTALTGEPQLNFAGFLAEQSGLEVEQHSVAEDSLAAMSSYLTSDEFQLSPPEFLVWEVPVWTNLALRGDQPMRELMAAARGECGAGLAAERTAENRIRVRLGDVRQSPDLTLLLDTGDAPARRADFHFFAGDGRVRSRPVVRAEGQPPTRRFYMPLTGLWAGGSATVEIETDAAFGDLPLIALCQG